MEHTDSHRQRERERERERQCVCVCVRERERERENKFMIGTRKRGHMIFVSHRVVLDVVLTNY